MTLSFVVRMAYGWVREGFAFRVGVGAACA